MSRPPSPPAARGVGEDPVAGLLQVLAGTRPGADAGLIQRAYDVAAYWHQGQKRKSGDPYISHPLAVATILAETGADDQTLCAALLHDTLEDTCCTLAALDTEFGAEIAGLVAGAMTLGAVPDSDTAPADIDDALSAAASGDARILVIKLADRREEWLGELSVLPARRERITFAVQTLLGIARLAVTLYRPAGNKRRP